MRSIRFFVLPHTAAHIATALATRITPNICAVANKALYTLTERFTAYVAYTTRDASPKYTVYKILTRSERNPMKDSKRNLRMMCEAAVIAALYAAITYAAAPLASGVIQVRISEALCVLPIFTPSAIPGVTLGCLLANLLTGSPLPDVIFGTLATLIGAIFTALLRRHPIPALLPPIISNVIIVPLVLKFAYKVPEAYLFTVCTVGAGEIISVGILGFILYIALKKRLPHVLVGYLKN